MCLDKELIEKIDCVHTTSMGESRIRRNLNLLCNNVVAWCKEKVVGAVWTRIMKDYGHIDDQTPSLAITLYSPYRGQGFGRDMMIEMLKLLKEKGYQQTSLSVQKENRACALYLDIGYHIVFETKEEYGMVYDFSTIKKK